MVLGCERNFSRLSVTSSLAARFDIQSSERKSSDVFNHLP